LRTIQRFFWGHLLIAAAAPVIALLINNYGLAALVLGFLAALWLAAQARRLAWPNGFFLFLFLIAGAAAFFTGAPYWLLLIGGVAALGAWDLYAFLQRLGSAERVAHETGLEGQHLRRLGLIEGIGLLLALMAITIRTNISFWWEALIVLVAIIGIARLVVYARRQAE
jgi:hypothetical protein